MENNDDTLLYIWLLIVISILCLLLGIFIGKLMVDITYVTTSDDTTTYLISCEKR